MGMRAAGHGYRVHMLQFMKGGASSVDAVRGEYNAIAALPGMSYENLGHYGWHGMADGGSDEADHEAEAQAGLERAPRTARGGPRRRPRRADRPRRGTGGWHAYADPR